jgi:hypothetical protein
MSALRLVNETQITSSVLTVNIENVFSNDFKVYQIISNGINLATTGGANINLRLINSSSTVVTSNYKWGNINLKANTTYSNNYTTNDTEVDYFFGRAGDNEGTGSVAWIFNPYSSSDNTYCIFQNQYDNNNIAPEGTMGLFSIMSTTSFTGLQVYSTSNIDEGFIRVYGLSE